MPNKYTYKISDGTDEIGCFPLYSKDATMVTEMESGQVFHRTKFSGSMQFIGEAASWIIASGIETRFEIQQKKLDYSTNTYGDVLWTGEFWKTDCEIDEDENTVTVQPATVDNYTALMRGIDKEFDLIELAPAKSSVDVKRQPIFQVYIAGANYITNYVGDVYWEQTVNSVITNYNTLINDYYFSGGGIYYLPGDDIAVWDKVFTYNSGLNRYENASFYIQYNTPSTVWEIYSIGPGINVMEGTVGEPNVFDTVFSPVPGNGTGTDTQLYEVGVFTRLLTNAATIDGNSTNNIPDPDIIPQNANYSKVIGLGNDMVTFSSDLTLTPTKFGIADDSLIYVDLSNSYFERPSPVSDEGAIPINRSEWTGFSMWFYYDTDLRDIQEEGSETITINDAYELSDALSAILGAIDPTLVMNNSALDNSLFYYNSNNPIDGVLNQTYYITPKSNIVVGNYDRPATKAKIKLSDFLRSLWHVHRVKWFIDADKNFKLEHIKYFEKGGSYSTDTIGTDVSSYVEPQTNKAWGYQQNKYTYIKQEMPERYEFSWMDDVSFPFEGYPIEINSAYTNAGQIEEEKATIFTTDIDFIFADPSGINERGFVFMGAKGGVVPFHEFIVNSETYNIQNGRLSFYYLHPLFHVYDLPASDIQVNDTSDTAESVKRTKQQEVVFTADLSHDPMTLITTGLGTGRVKSITENLNDGEKRIKIYHDTE